MRYVIMANGQGTRWKMFQGVPKHLIQVDGETLLARTTRLVHEVDPGAEVIISSANPDCVAEGAARHVPVRNELEIDRFVPELICDDVVFLYGDTYYTKDSISKIFNTQTDALAFFGNERSIVALKVADGELMRRHFEKVRRQYIEGGLDACKGWQIYHSYIEDEHAFNVSKVHEIGPDYHFIDDDTGDFNTPEDWLDFIAREKLG